jgi:hypothetical protein
MKFIKQLKLLTFQVIVSLIFLNTQISFAQNLNKWSEGPYVGVSLIFNTIKADDAKYVNTNPNVPGQIYDGDRERSKGIKIGYNKMLTDNIFVGPEFFFSKEKSLDFNDSSKGGVTDTIRFKDNYNIGLRAGYAVSKEIAYVLGYGRSRQTVETSAISIDTGVDVDKKNTDLYGFYRNFGILFNLGSGYNLELLYQINSINSSPINKPGTGARIEHDITIDQTTNTSITISKFF